MLPEAVLLDNLNRATTTVYESGIVILQQCSNLVQQRKYYCFSRLHCNKVEKLQMQAFSVQGGKSPLQQARYQTLQKTYVLQRQHCLL